MLNFRKFHTNIHGLLNEVFVSNPAPIDYALEQNFPNSFIYLTNLSCSISLKARVKLVVYNTLGKSVTQLVKGVKDSVNNEIKFNETDI